MTDLDKAEKEFHDAHQYRLKILCACASFVESRADGGDHLATGLAGLLADAEKRNQIAKMNLRYRLPATPERTP